MLKLRTVDNKKYKLSKDIAFIEICDVDGGLGALIEITNDGSLIQVHRPGDQTFENYILKYKSKLTNYYQHDSSKNML